MIEPAEIADRLVELLRDIPEFVSEMDGDIGRIYAYHDQYPQRVSLPLAVHGMPAPGVMIAWQGSGPGTFGGATVWQHRFLAYIRARETVGEQSSYYRVFRLLTKGVPASEGVPLQQIQIHPSVQEMDVPAIARATDEEGIDYFEVQLTFTEIGDD